MSEASTPEGSLSAYYIPLKNDVKHYSSIIGILDKLELDKNLEAMGHSFTTIIESEMQYAIQGLIIRTSKIKRINSDN